MDYNVFSPTVHISQDRYRGLVQSLASAVMLFDYDGCLLYLNDAAAQQLGAPAAALIGRSLPELYPQPYASEQLADIRRVIDADAGQIIEKPVTLKGTPRWHRTFIQPMHDEAGRGVHALVHSTDIHDIKTTQQELLQLTGSLEERIQERTAAVHESEEHNHLLFEESPEAMVLVDLSGRIVRVNRAYELLTRRPRSRLLGSRAEQLGLVTQDAYDRLSAAMQHSLDNQETCAALEYQLSCGDGCVRMVESRLFLLKIGGVNHILVTTHDITTYKQAEDTLRRANLELERAMRTKDEFLASMSHELRTPLTGILGLSEGLLYETYGALNEKQRQALATIESSGRHLLELINDILDISKIEAGKLELNLVPCELNLLCPIALQLVRGMAQKKGQQVAFSMQPGSITVLGDMRRLKQILVNLLSNAVKYTPENGSLGLEVSVDETARTVTLVVWDHGIGIAPQEMDQIFRPFVQLDTSLARQYYGSGLGLALVQRLVDLHGGRIEVESSPRQGSRFRVVLPLLVPVYSTY